MPRRLPRMLVFTLLLLWVQRAAAQGPPESEPQAAESPQLAEAKELFRRADALRIAGACGRAIPLYTKSRALVPSVPNTLNAALCLTDENRADEALELYATLLATLRAELTADELASVQREMRRISGRVGRLDVAGDADAVVVVAGRRRGTLPLSSPIPVLVGAQDVRVVKAGFEPHAVVVDIRAGQVTAIRASLKRLVSTGQVVIDDPALTGADVIVDGSLIGTVPFEGRFAPGHHTYRLVRDDVGSAPAPLKVLAGQTVTASAVLLPLGPRITVTTTPQDAALSIAGVAVGAGRWQGRLPVGEFRIEARRDGHVPRSRLLRVTRNRDPGRIELTLERDVTIEPPPPAKGQFWLELDGGLLVSSGFNGGAEQSCDQTAACIDDPAAFGYRFGARAGYELPFRLSFQIHGGLLGLGKDVTRAFDTDFRDASGAMVPIRYELTDQLRGRGGFVLAGISYRLPLFPLLDLRAHLAAGALLLRARDVVVPTASTSDGQSAAAGVVGGQEPGLGVGLLVMPELDLNLRLGSFQLGIGLAVGVAPLDGPEATIGEVGVAGVCDPSATPTNIACAPRAAVSGPERAYGPMVLVQPIAHVGYRF